MWSTADLVAEGDTVIIWQTREAIQPLVIVPGKEINGRFGVYRHSDLVGVPFGSKVCSRNGKGFIHVLRPTPELWTLALPHRTQILYLADIAFITSWLAIRPGCKVIEAGTGSGSFSHSIVRTIGPRGHLFTYEFHQQREEKAREEFTRHGMGQNLTLRHRNVCKDGFDLIDVADAVFLDLPAPWDAVEPAKRAMRKDRMARICCFSPCIEQVLRTVTSLNEAGFTDITMYETLIRPHDVSQNPVCVPISDVITRLKRAEVKKEERRQLQIARSAKEKGLARAKKRTHEETEIPPEAHDSADGVAIKRSKLDDDPPLDDEDPMDVIEATPLSTGGDKGVEAVSNTVVMSKVVDEVRGHTSYLTFACLRPLPVAFEHPIESHVEPEAAIPTSGEITELNGVRQAATSNPDS